MINLKNKKAEEGTFKNTLFGLTLVSLFAVLILTAVISMGGEYSKDTSTVVGGFNLTGFNQSLTDISSNAQAMEQRFEKGSIWSAVAGIVVEGIFGILIDIFKMLLSPFFLITHIMENILHIPSYVTGTILGLFIFGIIFAIWRLIKIGD